MQNILATMERPPLQVEAATCKPLQTKHVREYVERATLHGPRPLLAETHPLTYKHNAAHSFTLGTSRTSDKLFNDCSVETPLLQ